MKSLFIVLFCSLQLFSCSSSSSNATISNAKYPPIDIPTNQTRYFNQSEVFKMSVPDSKNGQTFFVDCNNGNDSWDGKNATYKGGKNGPFKTINKALDRYSGRIKGSNTIRIKAGIYHERISLGNLTGAISEDTRFTIGPYGDGEVIIDASDTHLLTWSPFPANTRLHQAYCDLKLGKSSSLPTAIVMDDNFKVSRPVFRLEDVKSFGQWYYDKATKMLYVHTNGDNPKAHDIIVIKNDRDNHDYGIYLTGDYITVYGLTVRGTGSYGIHGLNDYNRIEKCTAKYSGKAGIKMYGKKAELIKNHVYGNAILNWPRGNTWDTSGGWPNGMSGSGYAHIAGNIVHDNGGEGIGSMGGAGGIVIEDNISYDNWSVNIYVDNQQNDIIRRNLVYCTGVVPAEAIDKNQVPKWTNLDKIYKRMRPEGIMTGDEKAANKVAQSTNHQIYNNVVINCAKGYSHYGQAKGAGLRDFVVANNTIIMPRDSNLGGTWIGLDLPYHGGNNTNSVVKNNIVVGFRSDTPLVSLGGGSIEQGIKLDHNLYFNFADGKTFQAGYYPIQKNYDFAKWQNALGQDVSSVYASPRFVKPSTELTTGDYHLQKDSPAKGKGDLSLIAIVATDFDMITRLLNFLSIGAFE